MTTTTETYYVPEQSRWPIMASVALIMITGGAATLINGLSDNTGGGGLLSLLIGFLFLGLILIGWFGQVIQESQSGMYSRQMDRSFRWGMSWFIFSEVMFFAAFFGTLFYVRNLSVPWLAGEGAFASNALLWEGFQAQWPLMTTPDMETFPGPEAIIDPWHLPLLNTVLLLTSSVTITIAHHALKEDKRKKLSIWLFATIALGVAFLICQAYEYYEAYAHLGLTLNSGIYGTTFFMLTGFHGMHVTLGTLMLIIIFLRVLKGHFKPDYHFGFEAVAWYWHFVDVVWVGLFLFVYVF